MDRRDVLASAGALALVGFLPASAFAAEAPKIATGTAEDARLAAMLDRFFYNMLDDSPERATGAGLDKGRRAPLRARLDDYSAAGAGRRLAETKARLTQLRGIDRARLSPPWRINFDVIDYQLSTAVTAGERFKYGSTAGYHAPYVLSQLTGPYQDIPDFLDSRHPIADASDADAYLSRLRAFARAIDTSSDRQREDAAKGVFAPDFILDTTLLQLKALRDVPASSTILVGSLARRAKEKGLSDDYAKQAEAIVATRVFPALDRQIALVTQLRAKASHEPGVWRLPDGEAYYASALHALTTTDMTPEEVHQMGLDQVAQITARLETILAAQGLTQGTVGARLVALNDRPDQLFANTDEGRAALLDSLNDQIAATYKRLPELFATLPKARVEVRRVPVFIQDGSPGGYYNGAPLDGSQPAIYYINLKDTHDRPKFGLPTLTHHEAVPGHHLQISLSQESATIPLLRKGGGFSAYTEGWALYAEQLTSEIGMYAGDPLGEAGYLQSLLFRATRLVVDTGMHHKRWSREKATDTMMATTGIARRRVQAEIDRYTVWPGQACSYKVGHAMWERLRDRAKARLGPRFDIKWFHEVLLDGAMPLTVLERVIDARIAARMA